jgi:predicted branched-subunit amino acid permease
VLLGCLIGVAIYSTIKNGVGIFTLLPLVFVAFTINAWKKDNQALKDELKSRNLI